MVVSSPYVDDPIEITLDEFIVVVRNIGRQIRLPAATTTE